MIVAVPEQVEFRRKQSRLEWHFNPDCRRYPYDNFEVNRPDQKVMSTMICPLCKKLQAEEMGEVDNREPKGFFRKFF
jgi:hypothetical protein